MEGGQLSRPLPPSNFSKEIHATYETDRRAATEELLELVAAAMRSAARLLFSFLFGARDLGFSISGSFRFLLLVPMVSLVALVS